MPKRKRGAFGQQVPPQRKKLTTSHQSQAEDQGPSVLFCTDVEHSVHGPLPIVLDSETLERAQRYEASLLVTRGIPELDGLSVTDPYVMWYLAQWKVSAEDAIRFARTAYQKEQERASLDAMIASLLYIDFDGEPSPFISQDKEREESGMPPMLPRNYKNPVEKRLAHILDLVRSDPAFGVRLDRAVNQSLANLISGGGGASEPTDEDGFPGVTPGGDVRAGDDADDVGSEDADGDSA